MNKALSISGQQRFIKEGFASLVKNLKDFEEYDVFIHTWDNDLTEDIQLYDPCRLQIDKQIDFNTPNIHYSMFYSMKQSLKLIEDYPTKYDCIVRTRFDAFLNDYVNVEDFVISEGVYAHDISSNPHVISDWFNFGSQENMMKFASVFDNITQYIDKGNVSPASGEEMIVHHLHKVHGINLIKFLGEPNPVMLIRADDFREHNPHWHESWCCVSDLPIDQGFNF